MKDRSCFIKVVLSALIVLSLTAARKPKPGEMAVKKKDAIHTTKTGDGKAVACLVRGRKGVPGSVSKNRKSFKPITTKYKTKIKAAKAKLKAAKNAADLKLVAKLKKQHTKLMTELRGFSTACAEVAAAVNCTIEARDATYEVVENKGNTFDLTPITNCKEPFIYEFTTPPSPGTVQPLGGGTFSYDPGIFKGDASLTYRACNELDNCSKEGRIDFIVSERAFAGKDDNLSPYKKVITRAEARHLIRKLALNDISLLPPGEEFNLEELVNKILDPLQVAPDLKPFLERMRDGVFVRRDAQRSRLPEPFDHISYVVARDDWNRPIYSAGERFDTPEQMEKGLTKYLNVAGMGYNSETDRLHWSEHYSVAHFVLRSRYLSSLQARLAHLWFGHFGTGWHDIVGSAEYYIRDNFHLIYDNALGNFKRLILGVTKDACLGNGPGRGVLCDAAGNTWLSNIYNSITSKNQNFARELLELYLLGPFDRYTEEVNFTEEDVRAATAHVSGFKRETYQSTTGVGPNPDRAVDRYRVVWDRTLHDWNENLVAFRGRPFELKGSASPTDFVNHIIENHPGLPRYIAGKLFRMLAYPDPTPELIDELASRFKAANLDISTLIYEIAMSQAMFSEKSVEPKCVKSPWEIMIENYRNFGFQMVSPIYMDTPAEVRGTGVNNWSSVMLLTRDIQMAGEDLMNYPTVFGYEYCGRNESSRGEVWINQTSMVMRTLRIFEQVRRTQHYEGDYYKDYNLSQPVKERSWDFKNLKHKILAQNEPIQNLTPERVLGYFLDVYNIKISDAEQAVILKYLTEGGVWYPTDDNFLRNKFAGLVIIISSMSQANVR